MKPSMKIYIKIVIAIIIITAYAAFTNTFSVEFGLDAAMQQLENVELSYAPSAFMRAVNNYGWIAVVILCGLLFAKEMKELVNKLLHKENSNEEKND